MSKLLKSGLDFYVLKVLNYLGRYKRRDLTNAFFDANGTNAGLYMVVSKLYGIDNNTALNRFFSGRTTKEISDLIIDKLKKDLKDKEDGSV